MNTSKREPLLVLDVTNPDHWPGAEAPKPYKKVRSKRRIESRGEPFQVAPEQVIQDLGISAEEHDETIERLQREGWIERLGYDVWRLTIPALDGEEQGVAK